MVDFTTAEGYLELENEQSVKYTIQVADIFNLSEVKSSYLDSISLPKTSHNTQVLQYVLMVFYQDTVIEGMNVK